MAESLKNEKASGSRQTVSGRYFLRAALALLFLGVTVAMGFQGFSMHNALQWLLYLVLFVATDQIAHAIMNRIAKQENNGSDPSVSGPDSRLSH
jgi:hypothetical protein